MTKPISVFQRTEKKYLLDPSQRRALERALREHMEPDQYGLQTVANVYYDTPDCRLIRESLEKPVYKEKLRLRSYGRAERDGDVFVELKKKFRGVVYKRRESMRLKDAEIFLRTGVALHPLSQVQKEIDWFRAFHGAVPRAFVAYEREAYFDPLGSGLRLTFDTEIRCRDSDLSLGAPLEGERILPDGRILMEVKARGGMPLWLAGALSSLAVGPVSFSKYGQYYQDVLSRNVTGKGGISHVA